MILRVFPRRTNATPDDKYVKIGFPDPFDPLFGLSDVEKVHVSISFSWDIEKGLRIADAWNKIVKTEIGGPAVDKGPSYTFEPGMYLKQGYVITSRGCRNRCWFCHVWQREGDVHEIEIKEGHNILDDNILATSYIHFTKVIEMLNRQKEPIEFTGGLEAALLSEQHIKQILTLKKKPKTMFFAYDTPNDREPLFEAGKLLNKYGFKMSSHILRCYVLIGFFKDTFEQAEKRLYETIDAGFLPMAMLYRNKNGIVDDKWKRFQREWARPAIVNAKMRERKKGK